MDRDYTEAAHNQQKEWETEQDYQASEDAKAIADIETQEQGEVVRIVKLKTWEDTVIQQHYPLANHEEHLRQLQKQAKISFKAGQEVGFQDSHALQELARQDGKRHGLDKGIREVAEFVNRHRNHMGGISIQADLWQAFLKEKGIEE